MKWKWLSFLIGISLITVALFCVFYPTYGQIHPKMTPQQIDAIKSSPRYPLRNLGIGLWFSAFPFFILPLLMSKRG